VHISDEDCKDMMKYAIEHEILTIISRETGKEEQITLSDRLNLDDKLLLEDYAPKLFNTYEDRQKLDKIMHKLALLLSNYRKEPNYNKSMKIFYEGEGVHSKNKSEEKRKEAFQKHCDNLYGLLGTGFLRSEKGNELQKMLKDAFYNPQEYMPPKPKKITNSYSNIHNFLTDLKLPGKSDTITEFITKLR